MKFLKVTVNKDIINGGFDFVYPEGYDAAKISVEGYEHKTDPSKLGNTEFCLGKASDDFPENENIVAVTEIEYATLLESITPVAQ